MATTEVKKVFGSIPPGIVDHVHSYLRISIGRILWFSREHPRNINVIVKWWGERTLGKKIRISNPNFLKLEKYVEAIYAVRCPRKQFSEYLSDMKYLLLGVYSEKSEFIGTITISPLNHLDQFKPINGFFSIISKESAKVATIHIKLVIENIFVERMKLSPQLPVDSFIPQSVQNPMIFRNAHIPTTTTAKNNKLYKTSVTNKSHKPMMLSRKNENYKNSNCYQYITRDWKLSNKTKAADNGFNRMGSSFLKLEKPEVTSFMNNSSNQRAFTPEILQCITNEDENDESAVTIEHSAMKLLFGDNEMAAEIKAIKNMQNVSDSSDDDSFISYDDPAQNESILENLFYNKFFQSENTELNEPTLNTEFNERSRNSRKEYSSIIPKVTFEKKITRHVSNIEQKLSSSHCSPLFKARFMRIVVESCSLDEFSPFMKQFYLSKPSSFIIEYQYPRLASNKELSPNQLSMTNVRLIAKRIDKNVVYFGHRSVFPVKFSDLSLKHWMKLAVSFRLYVKLDPDKPPLLLGTAIFELQSVLESSSLSVASILPVGHSKNLLSGPKLKSSSIHKLEVKFELASDERGYYRTLSSVKNQAIRMRAGSSNTTCSKLKKNIQEHSIQDKEFLHIKQNDRLKVKPQSLSTAFSHEPFFIMLNISHGIGFEPRINVEANSQNNAMSNDRNLYLEYRFFDADDVSRTSISWSSLNPIFNYKQKFPVFLNKAFLERSFNNYMFVEVWDNHLSKKEELIGVCKVPLHQFYLAFKNVDISAQMMRCKRPVKSFEGYLPVNNISSFQCIGQLHVLLVAGTYEQICNLENSSSCRNLMNQKIENSETQTEEITTKIQNKNHEAAKNTNLNEITEDMKISSNSSLKKISESYLNSDEVCSVNNNLNSNSIEHTFIINVKKIEGLTFDAGSLWGETECFIQYLFPKNDAHDNDGALQLFQTSSVITTPNLEFQDVNRHTLKLDSSKSLSEFLIKIFSSGVTFTVWYKSYLPAVTEIAVAKGLLPISRLNSLITLWKQNQASVINIKLPLFKLHNWSEISGFLSVSISYSSDRGRTNDNILMKSVENEFNQTLQRLEDTNNSREHLLSDSFCKQIQNENAIFMTKTSNNKIVHKKETFTAQLSIEQAMHLTLNAQQNSLNTLPNAFVTVETDNPDDSLNTNFIENNPNPQWNWTANVILSLKHLLQANNLIFHLWHKQMIPECAKFGNENIHLGFATIDLTTLTLGMEKIDGWYNIMNFQGQCIGQLKILIIPLEDVTRYKAFILQKSQPYVQKMENIEGNDTYLTKARYCAFPNHIAQFLEQSISLHSDAALDSAKQGEANHNFFSSEDLLKEDGQTKSFVLSNLRKKFQELSELCAHLETQTMNIAFEKRRILSYADFCNKTFFNVLHPHIKRSSVSKKEEFSLWSPFKDCKSFSVENLSFQKIDLILQNKHSKDKPQYMKWRSLSAPCYSTKSDITRRISTLHLRNSFSALNQTSYQSPKNMRKEIEIYNQSNLEGNTCASSSNGGDDDEVKLCILNNLTDLNSCYNGFENEHIATSVDSNFTFNIASKDCGNEDKNHLQSLNGMIFNQKSSNMETENCDTTAVSLNVSISNEKCTVFQEDCFNQKNVCCDCMLLPACRCKKSFAEMESNKNSSSDKSPKKKSYEFSVHDNEQIARKEMLSEGSRDSNAHKSRRIAAAIFTNGS